MSLKQTRTIFRREFRSFFQSPAAYIVMTLYLLITGWFFFSTFFLAGRADMRGFFSLMPIILSFTIPAITMRQFSEEYRSGSMEILGTLPVTTWNIVIGKSLSSLAFLFFMLLPTLSYPIFISFLGDLDWGPIIGGYLGAILLGWAYIGIGLLASSTTRNQIVAFIIAATVSLFLSLVDRMLLLIPSGLGQILQNIGTGYHFSSISRGIVDSRDLLYFGSLIFLGHFAAWILNKENSTRQWIRFAAYTLVLILITSAAVTIFFRIDLTKNQIHSLSKASISSVSELEEPLTIKVFLSKNLPAPYNNMEQEIGDLFESYGLEGNKFFNYSIFSIESENSDESEESIIARADARSYGIQSIQIQKIEADEVQLVNAFMGMAFIQGDIIETIPVFGGSTSQEFLITSTINMMSQKTGAILALDEDIKVKLYLSSTLENLSPELTGYSVNLERAVKELNRQYYGRLNFERIDPDNLKAGELGPDAYNLPATQIQTGSRSAPETHQIYAGLVIENGKDARGINLLTRSIFGGYSMEDPEALSDALPQVVDTMVGINPKIAYLTDHGTLPLNGNPQDPNSPSMQNFQALVGQNYEMVPVSLAEGIPDEIKTLLVVSPQSGFTPYELYQLDQFTLKGNSVAYFMDTMNEIIPQGQNQAYGQAPFYMPRNTGLEPLMAHYGVTVENSYILDENCFEQTSRAQNGGVNKIPVYFAPMIGAESISENSTVTGNIKGLILLNTSPLTLAEEVPAGIEAEVLFSSSEKSWEMREEINLYNPMMIFPPSSDERISQAAAVMLSGEMTSYFAGKPLPELPVQVSDTETGAVTEESTFSSDQAEQEISLTEKGRGKVFITGSSSLLQDNVLDSSGTSPNATLLLNLMDSLNGREDYAVMRSKGQSYNPLSETTGALKSFVKSFNIVGLPIIVILFGILIWLRGLARKKRIEMLFNGEKS